MKKTYMTPALLAQDLELENMIAGSHGEIAGGEDLTGSDGTITVNTRALEELDSEDAADFWN